jgi:hypothetical protein
LHPCTLAPLHLCTLAPLHPCLLPSPGGDRNRRSRRAPDRLGQPPGDPDHHRRAPRAEYEISGSMSAAPTTSRRAWQHPRDRDDRRVARSACSPSCRCSAVTSKAPRTSLLREADMDGAAPADFYSTTNHRTSIFLNGRWRAVEHQRMDAALVVTAMTVTCRKLRDSARRPRRLRHAGRPGAARPAVARQADLRLHEQRSVVGTPRRNRRRPRRRDACARVRQAGGRIAFVAGPVWCTPAARVLLRADSPGLRGRCCSRATRSPCTTSRSRSRAPRSASTSTRAIRSSTATATTCGHQHDPPRRRHRQAVASGVLRSGIMHALHTHGVRTCSPAASATTVRCPRR